MFGSNFLRLRSILISNIFMIIASILGTIVVVGVFVVFFFKFREISKQNIIIMKDLGNLRNYVSSRKNNNKDKSTIKEIVDKMYGEFREFMCINTSALSDIKSNVVNIGDNVGKAVGFFKSPKGIGQFGERSLRKTLQGLGMVLGKDFFEQKAEGAKIPDCSIKIGNRFLHVDSKASNVDFGEGDIAAGREFIKKTKAHVRSLSSKKYHEMTDSFEYVLLFLPTDGVIYHLNRLAPQFFQEVLRDHKIIIVSPMLLLPTITMFREFPIEPPVNPTIAKLGQFASPKE
jgi:DNA recombination protein RmuC